MKFPFKKKLLIAALVSAFGVPATSSLAQSGDTQRNQSAQQGQQSSQQAQQGQKQQQKLRDMRASELIGSTVRDKQGQELGEVQDLIVDASDQRAKYAILAFGGVLGFGEKLFAYPMSRFQGTSSGDEKELVLSVNEQELKNAPGFDRSNWPSFGTSGYRGEVDKHFGQPASSGGNLVRMSELLDQDVSDRAGNGVGQIDDVVVSVTNGQVRFVALQPSDDLNLGDRIVMLPMTAIRATSEEEFKAQTGTSGSSEQQSEQSSGSSAEQQEQQQAQLEEKQEQQEAQLDQQQEQQGEQQQAQQEQQQEQASGASGSSESAQQESSGASGQQSATGQPQREGQQQQAQQQQEEGELKLVLNVPPKQLQNARSFKEGEWPDVNSRSFQQEMQRYIAAFPSGGTTTGSSGESATGSSESEQQEQSSGASSMESKEQEQSSGASSMDSKEQEQSSGASSTDSKEQDKSSDASSSGSSMQQEQTSGAPAQPDVPPPSANPPSAGLAEERPAGMGFPPGSERQENPPEWAPSPKKD